MEPDNSTERDTRIDFAMSFDGMTTVQGLILMDIFTLKALNTISHGNFLEFGTYKGRTAALFAQHLSNDRWLHTVEQADYIELNRLLTQSSRITWHKTKSEDFCRDQLNTICESEPIIVSHHDASHFFNNVFIEVRATSNFVNSEGVIILDDFNDVYSQVRAAYYYLRFKHNLPFDLLLIGFNKAILVHDNAYEKYEHFVLNQLLDTLKAYEMHCTLHRTDISAMSKAFFINLRRAQTDDELYGLRIWGDRFYKSASSVLKTPGRKIDTF